MGQASRRGTFEERKAQAIARREERQRIDREAYLLRQAERDAELDRQDRARAIARSEGRLTRVIGTGGFGRGGRSSSRMMVMAAMLAATTEIGPVMADDSKYR